MSSQVSGGRHRYSLRSLCSASKSSDHVSSISESPAIFTLPNEVMGEIIDLLPRAPFIDIDDSRYPCKRMEDVANLRLTCKRMADLGARNTFQKIHLSSLPCDIERFLVLSQHPVHRKYVKKIVYRLTSLLSLTSAEWMEVCLRLPVGREHSEYPVILPPDSTREEAKAWRRGMKEWHAEHNEPRNFYSEEQMTVAYDTFKSMVAAIEQYEQGGNNLRRLLSGLCQFPNLQDIETNKKDEFFRSMEIGDLTVGLPFGIEQDKQAIQNGILLCFIAYETLRIHKLVVCSLQVGALDSLRDPFPKTFPTALSNLTYLKLSFENDTWSAYPLELRFEREIRLGKFLKQATQLEFLSLEFYDGWGDLQERTSEPDRVPQTKRLFGDMTWPRLRSLELTIVNMTEDHAVSFMRRHSATLKNLVLSDIFLVEGTWASTFRQWKDCLALELAVFSGIFGVIGGFADETQIDPGLHLPMETEVRDPCYELGLGGREELGHSLGKYLTGKDDNDDFLEDWTSGRLPEGVEIVDSEAFRDGEFEDSFHREESDDEEGNGEGE